MSFHQLKAFLHGPGPGPELLLSGTAPSLVFACTRSAIIFVARLGSRDRLPSSIIVNNNEVNINERARK